MGIIKRRIVMSTVSRRLPNRPNLDVPKQQSRALLKQCQNKVTDALDRVRRQLHRLFNADDDAIAAQLKLSDAQFVVAREYGFGSWAQLKERITGNTAAQLIDQAIRSNDSATV